MVREGGYQECGARELNDRPVSGGFHSPEVSYLLLQESREFLNDHPADPGNCMGGLA
jgi:hypothetical protein